MTVGKTNKLAESVLNLIGLQEYVKNLSDNSNEVYTNLQIIVKTYKSSLLSNENSIVDLSQWLTISTDILSKDNHDDILIKLNNLLVKNSFITGNSLSLSDFVLFVSLYNINIDKYSSLLRWFDLIQNLSHSTTEFPKKVTTKSPVIFVLPNKVATAPQSVPTTTEVKSQTSTEIKPETNLSQPIGTEVVNLETTKSKKEKAVKVEKQPKEDETTTNATTNESSSDEDPSKLDIRVGKVVKCWDHPESDKLLCEEIDIGEGSVRTIASGLRSHYKANEVEGRLVVVLANLKERPMAGFKSQGMVLCACNEDRSNVKLLEPPVNSKVGDRITFPGYSGEPAAPNQVAKKKIFEKLAPKLRTDEKGIAKWADASFTIGEEYCSAPLPNAVVS